MFLRKIFKRPLLLVFFGICVPLKTFAAELSSVPLAEDKQQSAIIAMKSELAEGFNYILKTVVSGIVTQPADSTQNPNNDFLQIPRYNIKGEFRPDFSLVYQNLRLAIKPRFISNWQDWEDGSMKGKGQTTDDIYINEWIASYQLHENWFVSYGRENIQWGPSYLLSPSNPFFKDNGLSNPKQEVKGMDFVRTVWVMNPTWTFSIIGNTGEGEQTFVYGFEPAYAVKLDYTAFRKFGSLIGSYTDHDRYHFGGFGGWTVFDGLLLYTEDSFSLGTNALYPRTRYLPVSNLELIRMADTKEESSSPEMLCLLGASYTFETGQMIGSEYVYNSAGYSRQEAESYYLFRQTAAHFYDYPFPIGALSRFGLLHTWDTKLRLLRKNYLMMQFQQRDIFGKLNVGFRYTINMDDTSSQLISNLTYDLGDHIQLFLNGIQNIGNTETEFGSLYGYTLMVGFEYVF